MIKQDLFKLWEGHNIYIVISGKTKSHEIALIKYRLTMQNMNVILYQSIIKNSILGTKNQHLYIENQRLLKMNIRI